MIQTALDALISRIIPECKNVEVYEFSFDSLEVNSLMEKGDAVAKFSDSPGIRPKVEAIPMWRSCFEFGFVVSRFIR